MSEEMAAIKVLKQELRNSIKASSKQIETSEVSRQSNLIHHRLLSMPEYHGAKNIGIYLSMPSGEVMTKSIVLDALRNGKTVFVPYIYKPLAPNGPASMMDMVSLFSEEDFESLPQDRWGIPTPSKSSLARRQSYFGKVSGRHICGKGGKLDVILMPGVAFDKGRRRLGHGKGYYDVFLSQYHNQAKSEQPLETSGGQVESHTKYKMPLLVALALQQQLLPEENIVPTDSTDWQVDMIITGDGSVIS